MTIKGKKILLRRITLNDVSDVYLKWMNDYEVVKYTESRHVIHTKESLKDFVSSVSNNHNYCFTIIDLQTNKHIGNIKIGDIHPIYQYGNIGLIIGDKKYWGKGIATEAIFLCVRFAFRQLKLHRLYAGIYNINIGSIKAFEKSGFIKEGCEKEKCVFEGKRIDTLIYGIINDEISK